MSQKIYKSKNVITRDMPLHAEFHSLPDIQQFGYLVKNLEF